MSTHQDIERLAYEMWERDGRPEGNDLAYYYEAERALAVPAKPKKAGTRRTPAAAKPRTTRKAA